ncbi:hypothetical protein K501DRAFT_272388 [Backusella circina FSU 941]|nr:hypothetical protein K501DRAFT_272388 [Backusella circina FSU 941]
MHVTRADQQNQELQPYQVLLHLIQRTMYSRVTVSFFFDGQSITSILKSHGKKLFANYNSLSALCGFCIDGILDLKNNDSECSQRSLFTVGQWVYLNKYVGSSQMKHLLRIRGSTEEKIKEIIAQIKSRDEEDAYYVAIESIRGVPTEDK